MNENKNTEELHNISNSEEKNDEEEEFLYTALGHVVRRKILKIIGTNGFAGFSTFKNEINVSTGTIYHHIEILDKLITQDKRKKYILTDIGEYAFNFLNKNLEIVEGMDTNGEIVGTEKPEEIIQTSTNIRFQRFFRYVLDNQDLGIFLSMLIISTVALLCGFFQIDAFLYFFIARDLNFAINSINFNFGIFWNVIIQSVIIFLSIDFLCRLVFNKKENTQDLFRVFSFSFVPMIFYLVILIIFRFNELPQLRITFLILFQIWSMVLLANAITFTKNIRFERGLIIAIFIDYGAFAFIIILRNIPL